MVATTILEQLGGSKFLAMTGSKNLLSDSKTLRMDLVKNESKANKLWIILESTDTYTMRFFKFTPGKVNMKTFEFKDDKTKEIILINGIHADMLQLMFKEITGMDTRL